MTVPGTHLPGSATFSELLNFFLKKEMREKIFLVLGYKHANF